MELMPQLVPALREVEEETMYVASPQGLLCESYPPSLTVSFLGTLPLISGSPTKAHTAQSGSSINSHSVN